MKKNKKIMKILIEELEKTPIIELACQKVGITRQTFYRWQDSDFEFKELTEEAIEKGSSLINDMAETTLIKGIKDNNLTATIFWLKNRDNKFKNKVELYGGIKTEIELTEEEKETIKRSINNL